ncbi:MULTISPECIES: DUF4190 domain-containing protein [unclassified Streptomyces]|uniref:DUF4190 domain-containing protein n=1 Tax=unclassified Streptomyces TaxID=2593676 RepID=UPI0015872AD6|nr:MULTISPECIES: DUF4190 domain-containing protein [unclassified Streptomyces]NUV70367.1 DUF4190 domain-containing protein [Streptomyces sp. CAI-121]NUV99342.1 DUF4190 domain-containing protein [Streptomyces sp. CAI 127]NUW16525.1 DUF4190 domain-containing protein [Streptomyces sp. CAI-68]
MASNAQQTAGPAVRSRNTPARVAAWAAALGAGLIVAIVAAPMLWLLYGGIYTAFMFLCGLVAIPAGHLGRRRGKRLGGQDRGKALLAIVTGWLLILFALVLVLAYVGLVAGLGVLSDSAS